MIVYFSLLIPLLATFILWRFFRKETVWWEYLLPFAITLISIVIFKLSVDSAHRVDTEFLGSLVKQTRYYEPWNEYIHRTCIRHVKVGKSTMSVPYDCSYVQYHSARYTVVTTEGWEYECSQRLFEKLKSQFGNEQFVEMNRHFHTIDGDRYQSVWNGEERTAFPLAFSETYVNYVKAAKQSILHFEPVEPTDVDAYALKAYPVLEDHFQQSTLLGAPKTKEFVNADWKLRKINGRIGPRKHCRMYVLYFLNKPHTAALKQKAFWQGGNKNELIVCIGVDSANTSNVKWAEVFSWSKSERLKIDLRNKILSSAQGFDIHQFLQFAEYQVNQQFVRREFEEFSYLTVEPEPRDIILAFSIALVVSLGVMWFTIANGYNVEHDTHPDETWFQFAQRRLRRK